ncbi:MAG: phenylacetate-CoA oxygenase/reductase subunit PaaK, partial [Actinomycetota bacterium]|nr:phenylacetate-CoA oxygenase/reductase subunit PaaK [Actinomycetota bacterium]
MTVSPTAPSSVPPSLLEEVAPDTPAKRRASFHPLTVSQVRRLTEDAIEVTFAVPPE